MSILFTSEYGWIISHLDYLNKIYTQVQDNCESKSFKFKESFFEINSQYLRQNQIVNLNQNQSKEVSKKRKRKDIPSVPPEILELNEFIKQTSEKILNNAKDLQLLKIFEIDYNEKSRAESKKFYLDNLHLNKNFHGSNKQEIAVIAEFCSQKYIFPKNSKFFCYDIRDINHKFDPTNSFDIILLDPPWWNKSIRRKKFKFEESSYKMMHNEELAKIPLKKYLNSQGLVVVWCTNSSTHIRSIEEEIFPSWGVTMKAKWYWLKITQNGEPICNFNDFHGKQPYEQILFGTLPDNDIFLPDKKIIISTPSSVHSHKPPLTEILNNYLPEKPKCLEIFARYLLPDWTSWGLEVLKFQHLSLYTAYNKNESKEKT